MLDKIEDQLRSRGFQDVRVIPNGEIQRFRVTGNDESGWAFTYENKDANGKLWYYCRGGDFRQMGSEFVFCTKDKFTTEESKLAKEQIEKTKEKLKKELAEKRAKGASESEKLWNQAKDFIETPYTKNKKITGDLGVKTMDDVLIVPVKTIDSELVGLQKIFANGDKKFLLGSAKSGNFHLIGKHINGEVFIAEGFATAASIHMATGKPVVVAFDVGNLKPVAKNIRAKFPDTKIVICGDDDKHSKTGNAGRIGAEIAAVEVDGQAIFPEFSNPDSTFTDFNDLHVHEGIDAVLNVLKKLGNGPKNEEKTSLNEEKSQEIELELEFNGFKLHPLGTFQDRFFYISTINNRVISLTAAAHTKNNFFTLMPIQYWRSKYRGRNETVKWDDAVSDLMNNCQGVGFFNPDKIRGAGAWREKGNVILNYGIGVLENGIKKSLNEMGTKYFYQSGFNFDPPNDDVMTVEECSTITFILANLSWKKPESIFLLSGFIAVSSLCGALKWRPHVWLTGERGSGKTTILQEIIRPMLGDFSLYLGAGSTEAGIRQTIGFDARPVIYDEADIESGDRQATLQRIKSFLQLARQASSDSDARVLKGSAGGTAVDYRTAFCAISASIEVAIKEAADKSRWSILELEKCLDPSQTKWKNALNLIRNIDDNFRHRFFSRIYKMWPILQENIKIISSIVAKKSDARTGDQLGTLLGGYSILIYDNVISIDQAEGLAALVEGNDAFLENKESQSEDCLNHLVAKIITLEIEEKLETKSLGDFIKKAVDHDAWCEISIMRYGIKIHDQYVVFANSHPELMKLFNDTKWAANWKLSLSRIPGAKNFDNAIRFGSNFRQRGVGIPKEFFNPKN